MGGEGSMLYAMASLKMNRGMLKKRKVRELKDVLYKVSGKTEIEFKKLSSSELELIKKQIRAQAKKDAIWRISSYFIALILSVLFIWLVIWFFTG